MPDGRLSFHAGFVQLPGMAARSSEGLSSCLGRPADDGGVIPLIAETLSPDLRFRAVSSIRRFLYFVLVLRGECRIPSAGAISLVGANKMS